MIRFGTGGWRAIIGDEFIKNGEVAKLQQMLKIDAQGIHDTIMEAFGN